MGHAPEGLIPIDDSHTTKSMAFDHMKNLAAIVVTMNVGSRIKLHEEKTNTTCSRTILPTQLAFTDHHINLFGELCIATSKL